jgi:hypothetical protein
MRRPIERRSRALTIDRSGHVMSAHIVSSSGIRHPRPSGPRNGAQRPRAAVAPRNGIKRQSHRAGQVQHKIDDDGEARAHYMGRPSSASCKKPPVPESLPANWHDGYPTRERETAEVRSASGFAASVFRADIVLDQLVKVHYSRVAIDVKSNSFAQTEL